MEEIGNKLDELGNQITNLRYEFWVKYTLFTWQWWMFVGMCLVSLVAFLIVLYQNKKDILAILSFYGIFYILNRNLDDWAAAMDWYDYRMQLEPIIPTFLPANLFVIPMAYSILYQLFPSWKRYLVAAGMFSVATAYGALPLMKAADIYMTKTWTTHHSLISLIVIAALAKALTELARKRAKAGR